MTTTLHLQNKTSIAFVRSEQVMTRYGQRTVIHCINYGQEIKLWRGAEDPYAATLFVGDFIPVIECNGKYEIDKEAIAAESECDAFPLPPTEKKAKTQVEKLAETMGDCVRAMKTQLPDADDDLIQKYAVAIFIQMSKK